jgi:hypothetical protein
MRWLPYGCLALVWLAWCVVACQPADEGDEEEDESISVPLLVDEDEIFGFVQGAEIGHVEFSDTDGIVGTRVRVDLRLDDYARFQDAALDGTFTLINTNAIKDDAYEVLFTVDEDDTHFEFYVPQILSVPITLNFELRLAYDRLNVQDNPIYFAAGLVYEFNVNKGEPAS